jgi:hypothetical protein
MPVAVPWAAVAVYSPVSAVVSPAVALPSSSAWPASGRPPPRRHRRRPKTPARGGVRLRRGSLKPGVAVFVRAAARGEIGCVGCLVWCLVDVSMVETLASPRRIAHHSPAAAVSAVEGFHSYYQCSSGWPACWRAPRALAHPLCWRGSSQLSSSTSCACPGRAWSSPSAAWTGRGPALRCVAPAHRRHPGRPWRYWFNSIGEF